MESKDLGCGLRLCEIVAPVHLVRDRHGDVVAVFVTVGDGVYLDSVRAPSAIEHEVIEIAHRQLEAEHAHAER